MSVSSTDRIAAAALSQSAWGGRDPSIPLSKNNHLLRWVDKMARLTQPAAIHWVDGSQDEYDTLCAAWSETALSSSSTRNCGRAVSSPARILATCAG